MNQNYILQTTKADAIDQCQIFKEIFFSGINKHHPAILVTPICDIAQYKADHIAFCAILPFKIFFFKTILKSAGFTEEEFKKGLSQKQEQALIKKLKEFFNGQYPRYHWLGEIPTMEGLWYVDYQLIQSLSTELYPNIIDQRIAKLASPFKESIFIRYSSYMGRVGLVEDEKDRENVAKEVIKLYKK